MLPRTLRLALTAAASAVCWSCSPEASRVRDGGAGADPGNKDLVMRPESEPAAVDTTLWPGRAPTPVERLASGDMAPPASLSRPARARTPESKSR